MNSIPKGSKLQNVRVLTILKWGAIGSTVLSVAAIAIFAIQAMLYMRKYEGIRRNSEATFKFIKPAGVAAFEGTKVYINNQRYYGKIFHGSGDTVTYKTTFHEFAYPESVQQAQVLIHNGVALRLDISVIEGVRKKQAFIIKPKIATDSIEVEILRASNKLDSISLEINHLEIRIKELKRQLPSQIQQEDG